MTEAELFTKYNIDPEIHSVYHYKLDSYNMVKIFKIIHAREIKASDTDVRFVCEFLDNMKKKKYEKKFKERDDWVVVYQSAKRIVYHFREHLIKIL
jgi:hypothetical protein